MLGAISRLGRATSARNSPSFSYVIAFPQFAKLPPRAKAEEIAPAPRANQSHCVNGCDDPASYGKAYAWGQRDACRAPFDQRPPARRRGGRDSHALGPARDGGDASARHLAQPQLRHDRDELLDLGAASCDLEHEMLGGGVDDAGAEDASKAQGFDPFLAGADNLDEGQLPLQRLAGNRQVDHAMHVDQPFELAL